MLTEQFDISAGLQINIASGPTAGPPLLLLHGVTRRWQDFLTLMPPLALRWQVHALDFRGHGRSDRAASYLVRDYVRDVLALRGRFGGPVVLYGHSLGALVAAAVAAESPEDVRALVLEDPPSAGFVRNIKDSQSHGLFAGMSELARRKLPVPELARELGQIPFSPQRGGILLPLSHFRDATSLRFGARCLRDMDPAVLTPVLEGGWLEGYDVEEVCRRVRCSTLLLSADEDAGGLLAREDAERQAALIKDCVHIALPKVGHLVHWLQPDTTLRLVTGFLESL